MEKLESYIYAPFDLHEKISKKLLILNALPSATQFLLVSQL